MYYRNANCAVVVYDITQAVRPPFIPLVYLNVWVLQYDTDPFDLWNSRRWIRPNRG